MNLKEQIKSTGLTITKVAELIGIHKSNLSHYLNGAKQMPIHVEDKIKNVVKAYSKIVV
jgi:plasmid maintenance system antidote protein VapI